MTGVELIVIDEAGEPLPVEVPGELLIGGVQLAIGYLGASEADTQRFISRTYTGKTSTRWYRTGDLVRATTQPLFASMGQGDGDEVQYRFLGRIDSQVKIRGNRIELQEVESVLAAASGATMTAAIALPVDNLGISPGIVGFISRPGSGAVNDVGTIADQNAAILQHCRERLPAFAVPTKLIHVGDFPLNLAGKLDRLALLRQFTQSSENKQA
jgi:acyl-CoA synthetase (AMP-forming)/AMP-acid ligase II